MMSGIRDRGSGSKTPHPGSRIPDPGSRIPDPGSRVSLLPKGDAGMSTRSCGGLMALALVVTIAVVVPVPAAGQSWNPPRTADGQPDIQGIWEGGPGNAGHSLEEGCCEPEHN